MLTSFKVNGTELNAPNGSIPGLWLGYPIQGLEAPTYRVTSYDKAGQDGGVATIPFYGARVVTITGTLQRITDALYISARQALMAAFAVNRDYNGNIIPQCYQFTLMNGQKYFFYGQAKMPVMPIAQMGWSNWKVDIIVPQTPLWILTGSSSTYVVQSGDSWSSIAAAVGLTTLQLSLLNPQVANTGSITPGQILFVAVPQTTGKFRPPTGGGFNVPTNVPTVSSLVGVNSVTAYNAGDIIVPPTTIFCGSLTTPYIVDNTTGISMKVNYTLGDGDVVVVNTQNHTIMLNQNTSLLGDKDSTSDWWGLISGPNNISVSSGSSADTGSAEVTWYGGVSGI